MISEVALREFKELYLDEFKEDLSDEEAIELGTNLLSVMNKVYRPIKKDWLDEATDKDEPKKT